MNQQPVVVAHGVKDDRLLVVGQTDRLSSMLTWS
jgi:hypothetical protein